MRFSITKILIKYTAKITLAGTRTVRRTTKRTQNQRDAERDAAEAEKEWWEDILRQDAEDERLRFHKYNAEWTIEVQKYEEEVMKKQDQELKELTAKAEQAKKELGEKEEQKQQREQEQIKALRHQAYLLLTENSGLEDLEDLEDDELYTSSEDSFTLPPFPAPSSPAPPYGVALQPIYVPDALAKMAADDFILKAQLGRRTYIPWWADHVDV